jgi:fatty acid desaturase
MKRALFAFALLFSTAAFACATCGVGGTANDPNQGAYKLMTIVMSLTPLALIGSVVFWVFWRMRQHEKADHEEVAAEHLRARVHSRRDRADGAAVASAALPESP